MGRVTVTSLFLILAAAALPAAAGGEIPIRVTRLNDRAILLSTGETDVWGNVAAIAAKRGVVVVDTSAFPSGAAQIRRRIERELGRRDIAWVVNTHDHFDHTLGNQAFSDAVIVGHERCPEAMRRFAAGLEDFMEGRRQRIERRREALESDAPGSGEARRKREYITYSERMLSELESELALTPPWLTFSDRLTLDLGDITLNLIYYGEAHTESDLLVHVPEMRLLLVGDLFSNDWIPFVQEGRTDVSGWLEVLDTLLDGESAVEHVVSGHGPVMTAADLRAQRDYLGEIRDGLATAYREGLSFADAAARLDFGKRFGHLAHLKRTWEGADFHEQNLRTIWESLRRPAAGPANSPP